MIEWVIRICTSRAEKKINAARGVTENKHINEWLYIESANELADLEMS